MMKLPIQILSTDFDGTLHAEFETPPVPEALQHLIASLQAHGMTWVINTGRDLSSLMATLKQAQLPIWPDYVVTVEREIHQRKHSLFLPVEEWNLGCAQAHQRLFARVRPDVPQLIAWIKSRFKATIYEDPFSPFCLIAGSNPDADQIHTFLEEYSARVPQLAVVRNDVYARFSHTDYNKGSALSEIARRTGASADGIVAAGDHLNDLPMLTTRHAKWLIAPGNAVPLVKETVRRQGGYVSEGFYGHGVAEGVRSLLKSLQWGMRSG
jgi:hydroxymethylpyrimidine pyrophosphatase-like HAD family hydrolase